MENVDSLKKEKGVVNVFEFLGIIILFSFIFYILFPSKNIIYYSINENRNLALTEIYLKNIVKKYKKEEFIFALADIYIRQNKFSEANNLLNRITLPESFKLRLYKVRVRLMVLKENDNNLSEIIDFYSLKFLWENPEYEKYIDEFINKMILVGKEKEVKKTLTSIIDKNYSYQINKLSFIKYMSVVMSSKNLNEDLKYIDKYSAYFIGENEILNKIIRFYLQINRPDLARNFAIKVLKKKNIL
jgi:hypothetical protein